ncbi:hypothetical protein HELRODRAFT_166295 [Helobdella robusta]|uniref:Uncharacterized protein n=1 Tax=Helobdella robusta TaxID=6412 RepID=T1EXZ9_HELRO|nr:hypothetical protein HELRODRAFT_166295 [Helobdella robusta]ESN90603.1 hypothetical protein HELRODRAFT_166295 [Helobdella robusta]
MVNSDGQPDGSTLVLDAKTQKVLDEIGSFIDFLLRNIAVVTFKFNFFFKTRLLDFSIAMMQAEEWYFEELAQKAAKIKKSRSRKKNRSTATPSAVATASSIETHSSVKTTFAGTLFPSTSFPPDALDHSLTIPSFKVMNELNARYLTANHQAISELLDLFGRMKGLQMVAGNLMNLLSKRFDKSAEKLEDVRYYFKHWTGFCARTYNCLHHKYPSNQLPPNLSPPEVKFIVWPLAVRTAIYCASQFIKDTTELVGINTEKYKVMQFEKFMTSEELLTMKNILGFFQNKFSNMFNLLGKPKTVVTDENVEILPPIDENLKIFTEPITMDTILLNFPHEIPSDVPVKKTKNSAGLKKRRKNDKNIYSV